MEDGRIITKVIKKKNQRGILVQWSVVYRGSRGMEMEMEMENRWPSSNRENFVSDGIHRMEKSTLSNTVRYAGDC